MYGTAVSMGAFEALTPNTVELIPTLEALFPRGGPVQDQVLTARALPEPSCECNPQPSTLNLRPSTLNPQLSTLNPPPSTLNPRPSTVNRQSPNPNPES